MEDSNMEEYLINFHKLDIESILEDGEESSDHSLYINELRQHCPTLSEDLISSPTDNFKKWNRALITSQEKILKSFMISDAYRMNVKIKVHVRFRNLSNNEENEKRQFPNESDLRQFRQVKGTVVRITQARMLEIKRDYKCLGCKYIHTIQADYCRMFAIEPLTKCANPVGRCKSSRVVPINENKLGPDNCIDFQEIKIQEQVGNLNIGSLPSSIWVTVENDLVDSCQPGDDIIICGIVQRRWKYIGVNKLLDVSLAMRANSLTVCTAKNNEIETQADPYNEKWINLFWEHYHSSDNTLEARDMIINNFCPEIYGMYIIKLALVLTVIGGVTNMKHKQTKTNFVVEDQLSATQKNTQSLPSTAKQNVTNNSIGISIRGQSHLLLIGDPGTGKSELLKFAQKLCNRSVLTTGIGSTSAGLTCAAVKEAGEWNLEAGALVLSDGGVCFIDEFTSMKEHDRASIHEAMEQQTISVAKAGMVCKLSTRCSVVAAANPKQKYDPSESISINIGIAPPLLSRFDLIFILKDTHDLDWDELVSTHILSDPRIDNDTSITDTDNWSVKKFKLYFEYIQNINPKMSRNAEIILSTYYQRKRLSSNRDASRTTVRLLDSLIRLSQAHARLMFKESVEILDAVTAIILMEYSMVSDNYSGQVPLVKLQDPIKANNIESYMDMENKIIDALGLHSSLERNIPKKYEAINFKTEICSKTSTKRKKCDRGSINAKNSLLGNKKQVLEVNNLPKNNSYTNCKDIAAKKKKFSTIIKKKKPLIKSVGTIGLFNTTDNNEIDEILDIDNFMTDDSEKIQKVQNRDSNSRISIGENIDKTKVQSLIDVDMHSNEIIKPPLHENNIIEQNFDWLKERYSFKRDKIALSTVDKTSNIGVENMICEQIESINTPPLHKPLLENETNTSSQKSLTLFGEESDYDCLDL